MTIRKTTTIRLALATLALVMSALNATSAHAEATREFIGTIDSNPSSLLSGIAIDQETGNVYIYARNKEKGEAEIEITGPEGGPPVEGIPSKITGIESTTYFDYSGDIDVAVDNSCYEHQPRLTGQACHEFDPAYNDVYVAIYTGAKGNNSYIQQYHLGAQGVYEPIATFGFDGLGLVKIGVTVDSNGNVYAAAPFERDTVPDLIEFKKHLERVVNAGKEEIVEKLEEIVLSREGEALFQNPAFIAVDDTGDLYFSTEKYGSDSKEGNPGVVKLKLGSSGGVPLEELFVPTVSPGMRAVAVNRLTGDVFVGEPPSTSEEDLPAIAEYNAAGEQQLVFGSKEPLDGSFGNLSNGARGIAVNEASDRVYVINANKNDVDVFGPASGPPVVGAEQPVAVGVTRTSALISGVADPESAHATYYFEYVDGEEYAAGASDPYAAGQQTAVTELPGGHVARTVERLPLTGLFPGRTYHYRMVVSNASGTVYGPDETFATLAATPPVAVTGSALGVSTTSVTLTGVVSPRGLATSYVFEVGSGAGYGGARLFGSAGDGAGEVPVSVELRYLVPGGTYHYRLVATSFDGTSYGQDGMFTTPGVPAVLAQPTSELQVTGPLERFPSVAGAVSGSPSKHKTKSSALARALRSCKTQRRREKRVVCEAHARKRYKVSRIARPHKKGV